MIKEMTASELNADCRTYVALKIKDEHTAKIVLERKYQKVEVENNNLRVYGAQNAQEVVNYLYSFNLVVSEVKTDKISLEEYYIDLMNKRGTIK